MFGHGFCPTNDNQDGRQNGRRLSVCTYGRFNLVIYHPFTSKFHKWIFLTSKSCLVIRMWVWSKIACACLLALVDTQTKPLITRFLPTSIYYNVSCPIKTQAQWQWYMYIVFERRGMVVFDKFAYLQVN